MFVPEEPIERPPEAVVLPVLVNPSVRPIASKFVVPPEIVCDRFTTVITAKSTIAATTKLAIIFLIMM